MSDKTLPELVRDIQRAVGAEADGVFGPRTAASVWRELQKAHGADPGPEQPDPQAPPPGIDARSAAVIATLDPRVRARYEKFLILAKATAATFGCDYVFISGGRSMEEQSELWRKHQAGGPKAAPPGRSWHNFRVAVDAGVFRGKAYLDEAERNTAYRVHKAVSMHAEDCGLYWGGYFDDAPHWQPADLPRSPGQGDRDRFARTGTVYQA